jgi:hypothetical protein
MTCKLQSVQYILTIFPAGISSYIYAHFCENILIFAKIFVFSKVFGQMCVSNVKYARQFENRKSQIIFANLKCSDDFFLANPKYIF